jgi:hypothetical protein
VGAIQLLDHVLVEALHQGANAGRLLQPPILQLRPRVAERTPEALRIGDLMEPLVEGCSLVAKC